MRFLMLIRADENAPSGPPPDALLTAMSAFRADTTHGTLLDDGGLHPAADGLLLTTQDGRVTVVDGPFAESKEVVGGFFLVESPSSDDMAAWATAFTRMHAEHWPGLSYVAEVRQIA